MILKIIAKQLLYLIYKKVQFPKHIFQIPCKLINKNLNRLTAMSSKQSRTPSLPSILPELSLRPDQPPPSEPPQPIDFNSIVSRLRSRSRPSSRPSTPKMPSPANLLNPSPESPLQLRRLREQYEQLQRKYQQGELAFMQLRARCEFLEEERLEGAHEGVEVEELRERERVLQSQIKLLKEELIKAKALEEKKGNVTAEAFEIRRSMEQVIAEKDRLALDLIRVSQEEERLNKENLRLLRENDMLKQENIRMKNDIANLKGQRHRGDSHLIQYQTVLSQLQIEKQNAMLHASECQRLIIELDAANKARQRQNKEFQKLLAVEKKQLMIILRSEIEKELKGSLPSNKDIEQLTKAFENLSALKVESDRKIQSLNEDLALQKSKCMRLEAELISYQSDKKVQEESSRQTSPVRPSQLAILHSQIQHLNNQRLHLQSQLTRVLQQNQQLTSLLQSNHPTHTHQSTPQQLLLRKHLDLSVQQIRQLTDFSKQTNNELLQKVQKLSTEKQELEKKHHYQQIQLGKLYEVLQTRKDELEACYRTIEGLRSHTTGLGTTTEDISQILRTRRQHLY